MENKAAKQSIIKWLEENQSDYTQMSDYIWENPEDWDATALDLGKKFIANFEAFADTEATSELIASGPQI